MSKALTLAQIKKEVKRMDDSLSENDDAFRCAVVLFAALQIGQSVRALHQFTKYDTQWIRTVADNLRRNGIWKRSKTYAEWTGKDGGIAFWLDVNVARGLMRRA